MGFDVAATAYDRFMGRYSGPLAPLLADLAGIEAGLRALDVGCGPGALTGELVRRLGAEAVGAIDPSAPFVAAARERHPGVDVREGTAERLPWEPGTFDRALAQLVVQFMADPVAGLAEMARVTRPGGVVAVCVWDHGGGLGPLGTFWEAAHALDQAAPDESNQAGVREGQLVALLTQAGLREVEGTVLTVAVDHPSFEEWWEPYTLGVGPAGSYAVSLDPTARDRLRDALRERLGAGPFTVEASAWAARGVV
jgi:SAM-dependent methyltransferase